MADDAAGAVRRTPRPHPADDHQTPETGAPVAPGATNPATPVSQDAGTGTGPLSPEAAEALAALRAKLAEGGPVVFAGPECDMEAYAALPPCTACEGGGQDTHGTVFEAPLAVHFAGPAVEIADRRRQLCMWCGHVLRDSPRQGAGTLQPWTVGVLVRIEDGVSTVVPHEPGAELPPGCCALPDDEEPHGYGEKVCRRCDAQAAFCPCEFPDVEPDHEPPLLENDAERLADEEHALAAEDATYDDTEDDAEDDADWPAEPEDGDRG